MRPILSGGLALSLLLAACAQPGLTPTEPGRHDFAQEVESQLHFLQAAATAPRLAATTASFYAVSGQTREGSIWYHKDEGGGDSVRLVRLTVDRRSLVQRPDGTPIAPGDSLLITMTVVDTVRLIVEMQPSGLRFAPGRPARLNLTYLHTNHDFNGDGTIDAADAAIERSLAIWKQESPDDPWGSLVTDVDTVSDEAQATVPGFTRFAVAY